MAVIEYRCTKGGHVFYLRTTSMLPDPKRWEGSACGYCLRSGVPDSVMTRTRPDPA